MNKPAPKEPSMDEILSSIRQIIADDDAAVAPKPSLPPLGAAQPPRPIPSASRPAFSEPDAPPEPLALSAEQIVSDEDDEADVTPAPVSFEALLSGDDKAPEPEAFRVEPQLVDPEDVAFEVEEGPTPVPVPRYTPPPAPPLRSVLPPQAMRQPMSSSIPPPPSLPPRPIPRAMNLSDTAPMPDPTLSRDMAEQLLEPTTGAAVKGTLSKLSALSSVGQSVTIEAMMREMLRPMLKEWLDEHLPSVVERMVEKEIARISRGGE